MIPAHGRFLPIAGQHITNVFMLVRAWHRRSQTKMPIAGEGANHAATGISANPPSPGQLAAARAGRTSLMPRLD